MPVTQLFQRECGQLCSLHRLPLTDSLSQSIHQMAIAAKETHFSIEAFRTNNY